MQKRALCKYGALAGCAVVAVISMSCVASSAQFLAADGHAAPTGDEVVAGRAIGIADQATLVIPNHLTLVIPTSSEITIGGSSSKKIAADAASFDRT